MNQIIASQENMWKIKKAKDYDPIRNEMIDIFLNYISRFDMDSMDIEENENIRVFDARIDEIEKLIPADSNVSSNKLYEINELLRANYNLALIIKLES